MHVLMAQSDTPGARTVAARLRAAGVQVSTCYAAADSEFCRAVEGEKCPLSGEVDASVVVRAFPSTERLPGEEVAVCSAARGVPVIIAGASGGHPYGSIATADDETFDVLPVLRTVTNLPLVHESTTATAALRAALEDMGVSPGPAWADVKAQAGGLRVHLHMPSAGQRSDVISMCAVRVLAAVRDVSPRNGTVNVSASPVSPITVAVAQ
jgi:hypothetical protein